MNHWLIEHFDGQWCGGHHECKVPDHLRGYLVFTIVRNPYDRHVSGYFGVTWDEQAPSDEQLRPYSSEAEKARKMQAFLKAREGQVQRDMPRQSPVPLQDRIRDAVQKTGEGHNLLQKTFVERSGVSLVLYFERLPKCLTELPFVDPDNMPPFPHHPERGIRPQGDFFSLFAGTDVEQVIWAQSKEDFEAFGYERFNAGLPEDAPSALRIE